MNKYKTVVVMLFTLTFLANAYAQAIKNLQVPKVHIFIKNNMDMVFPEAQIYISNENRWVSIGSIGKGDNEITLDYDRLDDAHVFQLEYPNGQWVAGIVKRIDSQNIYFEINQQMDINEIMSWEKNSLQGTIPAFIENKTQPNCFELEMLFPIND